MKKISLFRAILVVCFVMFVSIAEGAFPAQTQMVNNKLSISTMTIINSVDYTGTWVLDKEQSKGLSPFYSEVESHKLFISQKEQKLTLDVEITLKNSEADKFSFVYKLDGKEEATETNIRTQRGLMKVPITQKAEQLENGNLKITTSNFLPDGTLQSTVIEKWELSKDGKKLSIHREINKKITEMVFVKG